MKSRPFFRKGIPCEIPPLDSDKPGTGTDTHTVTDHGDRIFIDPNHITDFNDNTSQLKHDDTPDVPMTRDYNNSRVSPQLGKDETDYIPSDDHFSCLDACIYLFSIGTYLADVGTDIWVAYMYYHEGHVAWFTMTTVFILFPAVTTTAFSLAWYIHDHRHHKSTNTSRISKVQWASRTICLILHIGPVIRYIECLLYGVRSKKTDSKDHWYSMLVCEDADSTLLRLFECFLEAAPQLVLQLYVMNILGSTEGWIIVAGQIASCVTSLASVSWALAAYHKALRYSLPNKSNMTYGGMALQFFWRFFMIGSRVITLAMFAAVFKYWALVATACHWIVMFVWVLAQRTRFCDHRWQEVFYNLVVGIVYIFCYLNLHEGHTRLRYIFYYSLTYAENMALMLVWYSTAATSTKWYITPAMVTVFAGFFIGLLFMLIYYKCLHPNNLDSAVSKEESIKVCVPWAQLYLCQPPTPGVVHSGEQAHMLHANTSNTSQPNQV